MLRLMNFFTALVTMGERLAGILGMARGSKSSKVASRIWQEKIFGFLGKEKDFHD